VITELLHKHTTCSRVVWRPVVGILKEEGIDLTSGSSDDDSSSSSAAADSSQDDVSPLSSLAGGAEAGSSSSSAGGAVDETASGPGSEQTTSSSSNGSSSSSSSGGGSSHPSTVQVFEAGLTFLATPEAGQKTGGCGARGSIKDFTAVPVCQWWRIPHADRSGCSS